MCELDHGKCLVELQDRVAAMTTREIQAAFLFSGGAPGDPWADALARAMHDREIEG